MRTTAQESGIELSQYFNENYFKMPALASLCEQIVRIYREKPRNLLEIGKGNGFVSNYLKSAGVRVTTFDINPALEPDVVGDVRKIDEYFSEGQFDWILCAEVLEHIPFEASMFALDKIRYLSSRGALVTIPHCQKKILDIQGQVFIRLLKKIAFDINIFYARPGVGKISDAHAWELDHSPETRYIEVKRRISEKFLIADSSRSRLCPYHRFFTLHVR